MIVLFKYSQPFILIPIFFILLITPSIQKLSFAQAPIKSEKWAGAELQEIERVIENTTTGKKIQFVLKKDGTINTDLRVVDGAEISENARWLSSGNGSLTINVETKGTAKNVSWTKNHIEDLKLQPNGECSGSIKITFTVNANGRTFSQKMEGRVRYRVVFSSKPDELSINEKTMELISQALEKANGRVNEAEKIIQNMRRVSQEASDNPALIRAQYWLKGRNGATNLLAPLNYGLGLAYLTDKQLGTGFDSYVAWWNHLPWQPAPYDPETWDWFRNGVRNTIPIKK